MGVRVLVVSALLPSLALPLTVNAIASFPGHRDRGDGVVLSSLAANEGHWRRSGSLEYWIAGVILCACLPAIITYFATRLRCRMVLANKKRGKAQPPPSAPYWFPFVGNALDMIFNSENCLLGLQ